MIAEPETIGSRLCRAVGIPPELRVRSLTLRVAANEVVTATVEVIVDRAAAEAVVEAVESIRWEGPPANAPAVPVWPEWFTGPPAEQSPE